jgi:hypothetical protein
MTTITISAIALIIIIAALIERHQRRHPKALRMSQGWHNRMIKSGQYAADDRKMLRR